MPLRFSGSYKRLAYNESPEWNRSSQFSLSREDQLRAAQLDIAAIELSDRILNEVGDDYQITYDPYGRPDTLVIMKRQDGSFKWIQDRTEQGDYVGSTVHIQQDETEKAFLARTIEHAKFLDAQLKDLARQVAAKNQRDAQAKAVAGWILPRVEIADNLAVRLGPEQTERLAQAIRKNAKLLLEIPNGLALSFCTHYASNAMTLMVMRKDDEGLAGPYYIFSPHRNEGLLHQKIRLKTPWFTWKESPAKLLERGVALAKTMKQQALDLAAFEQAYAEAVSDGLGNYKINPSVVQTKGLPYALRMLTAMKQASPALYAIAPDIRMAYHDKWNPGEAIHLERLTRYGDYMSLMMNESDRDRANINPLPGESVEDFVGRAVTRAEQCLADLDLRDRIRANIPARDYPAFTIGPRPSSE
jgi:hypothetical protein